MIRATLFPPSHDSVPVGKEYGGGSDENGTLEEKGFEKLLEQQTPQIETGAKKKHIRPDHDAFIRKR
ncbi:hypothetical protein B0A55_09072 [Friedmanniomyces simplex]|uniref:Uncharacterized protein n=1 Tax=Friedmanniomyces simplex TaxID=329884 RepID=A0A4V5NFR0_9PEZI|nr:hypothetical protein B0A55_09072 [Friedmanniomyces simplex]